LGHSIASVYGYAKRYLHRIAHGDAKELAGYLQYENKIEDVATIAKKIIEYHVPYDIRRAGVEDATFEYGSLMLCAFPGRDL
jgi:hypothetical protein